MAVLNWLSTGTSLPLLVPPITGTLLIVSLLNGSGWSGKFLLGFASTVVLGSGLHRTCEDHIFLSHKYDWVMGLSRLTDSLDRLHWGPMRKHCPQQLLCRCVHIHCHGNVLRSCCIAMDASVTLLRLPILTFRRHVKILSFMHCLVFRG
jgi:hypothetical protein